MPQTADHLKRVLLMTILALAGLSSAEAWVLAESTGRSSLMLRVVLGVNMAFHPVMFVVAWKRWLPTRTVEIACLLFAIGACAVCMVLRLYSTMYGASIDIKPLYLWIPVIYVFVFTLVEYPYSLKISLAVLAVFVLISVPALVGDGDLPDRNFTFQMHLVCVVLIAVLHFFSRYQRQFQIAQLSANELARLANTDELTRLANRRRIAEVIESELSRSARYGPTFSIILIDIDEFKSVNDRFGHGVGDKTLVALAARTAEMLRDVDTLGRWGGEEFVVIFPETPLARAVEKAAALCAHVAVSPLVGEHTVTISCGVTGVLVGDSLDTLLQRADVALYAAKRNGRNRAESVAVAS